MKKASLLRAALLALLAAGLLSWTAPSHAQDENLENDEEGIQQTETTVDVTDLTQDEDIESRLLSILETLEARGLYVDPSVEAVNGVVYITGSARSEEAKAGATRLAERTEGVIFVSNTMTISRQPIWSIQPAKRELTELWREIVTRAPLFVVGLVIWIVIAFVGKGLSNGLSQLLVSRTSSDILRTVVSRAFFLVILIIGTYLFLRVTGLTRLAMTVAGGTGIAGIVLGFAFRDIAENFLASILISIQRPFHLGDVIEVEGYLGIVRKVTTRGSVLMDFDGNHIQIANATIYKSTIKNFTANPNTRISFVVGIGYDTDIEHAQQLALDTISAHEAVLDDPPPQILVDQLAASTVNLKIYFWIDGSKYSMLKLKSVAMRLIVSAFEDAGISMPDDAREIIFPDGVPVEMLSRSESDARDERERRQEPVPSKHHDEAPASTPAEGGLETEAKVINRQAERARDPEEGSDLMGESPDDNPNATSAAL